MSNVSLLDRRGYLTLLLQLHNEDNLVLRKAENIRDWYNVILGLVQDTRAKMMPSAEQFWKTKGSEVWSEWAGPRREREVQDRPSSVASVDRRHRHRHRHHRRRAKSHSKSEQNNHIFPGLLCLYQCFNANLNNKSDNSAPSEAQPGQTSSLCPGAVRSVSVDRDSGNYSLQAACDRLDPPDF